MLQLGARGVDGIRRPSGGEPLVDTGFTSDLVEADDGLFGFLHFPPGWRPGAWPRTAQLQRRRRGGGGDPRRARGRRTGDRRGRRHSSCRGTSPSAGAMSHTGSSSPARGSAPLVVDPFACRNELGRQEAVRQPIEANAWRLWRGPSRRGTTSCSARVVRARRRRPTARARALPVARPGLSGLAGARRPDRGRCDHPARRALPRARTDDRGRTARRTTSGRSQASRISRTPRCRHRGRLRPGARRLGRRARRSACETLVAPGPAAHPGGRWRSRAGREPSSSVADTLDQLAALEPSAAAALPGGRGSV